MTNDISTVGGVKSIEPPDSISGGEQPAPAIIPKVALPDALTISSRDMGKLTIEFCSYDGSAYQGLEILKNAAKILSPSSGPYGSTQENPEKPSELNDIRKNEIVVLFNSFILLANEPKRDWCKGGVSSGGWPYKASSTNAPAYTLNKGLWAMTKVFPWQDSDTFSFCEIHNNHLQTTREELPDEVRVMIEKQAEASGLKSLDDAGKVNFFSRLDACVNTMKGAEEYVNYGDKRYDLKGFCVDTMKMVSPEEKAEEKPAGGFSRWGGSAEDTEKTPVKRLEALLDERLLDIPWNRWVYREEFCKEATTKWSHKAVGVATDVIALIVPFITWGGRFLIVILAEKTVINTGKRVGKLIDKVVKGVKKLKTGGKGGPDDPAGGAAAGSGEAKPAAAEATAPAGAGAAKMSATVQFKRIAGYESDVEQAVANVPLWKRLVAGASGFVGLPANPNAAAFGGVQTGAGVYLGVPVPVVP